MKFHLFIYATLGRRHELEAGMAGKRPELYQRMLSEVAEYAQFADEVGYAGFGHPEHHLQIEGFEASNEPGLLSMWIGQHSKKLRVNMVGWVAPTHNPVRTAEYIATLDHMLKGRLAVGMVRGYQARWVHNFRIRPDLNAVGDWNRNSEDDNMNREYFREFVEVVLTALKEETFSYQGKYWTIPPEDFVNPHPQGVYTQYGTGVDADMRIREIGIAPKPYQNPHPPIYGGFTHSMRTALFWARYRGKPIVLASDLDFCQRLWSGYHEEALKHGHDIQPGDEAAWGGAMICHKKHHDGAGMADRPHVDVGHLVYPRLARDILSYWLATRIRFPVVLKKRARNSLSKSAFSSSSKGFTSVNRCSARLTCSPTKSCLALPIRVRMFSQAALFHAARLQRTALSACPGRE